MVVYSHPVPPPACDVSAGKKIVKPLWEPFVALFPELVPLLRNLNNNCDHYFNEGERLQQQRISAAAAPSENDHGKDKVRGGGGGGDGGVSVKKGLAGAKKKMARADGRMRQTRYDDRGD